MEDYLKGILHMCMKVNGVLAYYPLHDETSNRPLQPNASWTKKYGWNNGVLAFVTEDGSYYVTPYCMEVVTVLQKAGYTDIGIYVPFSNTDIPSDKTMAAQWESMCIDARNQRQAREERERQEKLEKHAKEILISRLPEEVYALCLEIPKDGLETNWMGEIDRTTPISEDTALKKMGTYCTNNGRVSFVNENGVMYVSPYVNEVIEALVAAGYRPGGLYVPLSNGEVPTDPALESKWDSMDKTARLQLEARIEREKEERYRKASEDKRLKDLPEEAYQLSIEIPKEGLETSWYGRLETTYPEDDYNMTEKIGTYCSNNGIVTFVDSKGRKFVSPFYREIREMLSAAGYTERGLYVPLSNGEVPTDPIIATKWETMWRNSRNLPAEEMTQGEGQAML